MGNSPSKDGSNSTATTLNSSTGSSTLLSPPQPANDDPDPSRSSSLSYSSSSRSSNIINSLDDNKKSRALNIKSTNTDTTNITRHSHPHTHPNHHTHTHTHSSISRSKSFNSKLKPSSSPSSVSSNSPPPSSRHNSHSHPHSHSHHGSALKPSKSNKSTNSSSSSSSSSSNTTSNNNTYNNNNISPFELELAASTAKAFNISRSPRSNITSTTNNSNNDEMASSVSSNVSAFTSESVTSISSVTTTPPNLKDIQSLYPIDERSVENTPEPNSNLNYNLSSSSSTSLISSDNITNINNNNNINDLQIFNQEIEDHFEITKIPTSNSSTTDSTLTDSKIKSIDLKKKISTSKKSKSLESSSSTNSTNNNNNNNNNNNSGIDLDKIVNDLINLGLSKKLPRKFNLSQKEIKYICAKARDTFLHQPMLLELAAPVKVVGDLHGQFNDLLRIFKMCGYPPNANYLFLGDYVDRGKQSLETIILLLCLKIKYPENFFLLRGNHESASITKMYGFFDECKRRCNVKTWKIIVDVFNTLPVAATIADRIFCVHGGLSPQLTDLKQIKSIQRPTDIPETGLLADLLWSDPESSNSEWSENDRGVSYCFNKKVVNKFNDRFEFDLIARGHMVVEQGYEFFAKRKLVTIFSAPNYCGEFNNWGAVMNVDKKLMCSFELLKPNSISTNSSNSLSPFKK
ncbi:hypothetical protein B5S31_g3047 [[Candida] boidinii]|nr:hypothetical protein B5S31_g3047 [[Candida] boidinii]